jgi:hypothetical protein
MLKSAAGVSFWFPLNKVSFALAFWQQTWWIGSFYQEDCEIVIASQVSVIKI